MTHQCPWCGRSVEAPGAPHHCVCRAPQNCGCQGGTRYPCRGWHGDSLPRGQVYCTDGDCPNGCVMSTPNPPRALGPITEGEVDEDAPACVEAVLRRWFSSPAEHRRPDGSYLIPVEDDEEGDAAEMLRREIDTALPEGWQARWTGNGNGNCSDLHVFEMGGNADEY